MSVDVQLASGSLVARCVRTPCAAVVLCAVLLGVGVPGARGVVTRTSTGRLLGLAPRHADPFVSAFAHARAADIQVQNFTASYEDLVTRFLGDVAADSGNTTNSYAVTAQYGSGPLAQTALRYHVNFSLTDVFTISQAFPADQPHGNPAGCISPSVLRSPSDPPYAWCLTDAQIQQELGAMIAANRLTDDLAAVYLVLLPAGVDVCNSSGAERPNGANPCADTDFCGYHSNVTAGGPVYAVLPYAGVSGCESGQAPNGDAAADSELSLLSHEHNDATTDPLLGGSGVGGWYESANRAEVSDKCAQPYVYGGFLGAGYNQVINSHVYYLQDEFANADGANPSFDGCEQRPGATNDGVSPSADGSPLSYHGGPVLGTHTVYLFFWDPEGAHIAASSSRPLIGQPIALTAIVPNVSGPLLYSWNFGDGTATTAFSPTVTHAFTTPGDHTITLTAADQTASLTFYVLHDPTVSFSYPRSTIRPGERVRFRIRGWSDPDGIVTSWRWRFGDGTGARGKRVTHVYVLPGRYTVTLTVVDSNGSITSRTVRVIVRARAHPRH